MFQSSYSDLLTMKLTHRTRSHRPLNPCTPSAQSKPARRGFIPTKSLSNLSGDLVEFESIVSFSYLVVHSPLDTVANSYLAPLFLNGYTSQIAPILYVFVT
jgi:hypothetical protein